MRKATITLICSALMSAQKKVELETQRTQSTLRRANLLEATADIKWAIKLLKGETSAYSRL